MELSGAASKEQLLPGKTLELLGVPRERQTAERQMGILSLLLAYFSFVYLVFPPLTSGNTIYLGSLITVFHYRSWLLMPNLAGVLNEQSQSPEMPHSPKVAGSLKLQL